MAYLVTVILILVAFTFTDGQQSLTPGKKCGLASASGRVVGGKNATADQAPWNAILELKTRENPDKIVTNCGGSIVTASFILSAAHCVSSGTRTLRPQDINVYVGISQISPKDETPKLVNRIYLHEDWDTTASVLDNIKTGHDIAIIRLEEKLIFNPNNPNIRAVCLPYQNMTLNAGKTVIINGYGLIDGIQGIKAKFLQQGHMQLVSKDTCATNYNAVHNKNVIVGDQLCAHGVSTSATSPTIDSCNGDSGSGLVTLVGAPAIHILVGLVSFGQRYCNGGLPGVYTNVQSHLEWIKEIVSSSCPSSTVCAASSSCEWFNQKLEKRKRLQKNSEEYKNITKILKENVCNKKERKICCP